MHTIKIKKIDIITIILLVGFTPFSLCTIFFSLLKNSKLSIIIFSILVSWVSYSYKPFKEYDKTRHFEFFNYVQNMDFNEFWQYTMSISPDFVFYTIMYLFNQLGLSFHQFVFFITLITTTLILLVLHKKKSKINFCSYFMSFIGLVLTVFSLYYLDLFSGMRFYLSTSFFVLALSLKEDGKQYLSYFLIFVSLITHFGIFIIFTVYFLYNFVKYINFNYLKAILILTLLLSLFSENYLSIVGKLGFSGVLNNKIHAYLGQKEVLDVTITQGRIIFNFLNTFWLYVLNLYIVFFSRRSNSNYFYMVIIALAITNLFIPFIEIFTRYALVVKILMSIYIFDSFRSINKILIIIFAILFFSSTIGHILVISSNLIEIFIPNIENMALPIRLITEPYKYEDIR